MEWLQHAFRLFLFYLFLPCVAIVLFIHLQFFHYYLPHDSQTPFKFGYAKYETYNLAITGMSQFTKKNT